MKTIYLVRHGEAEINPTAEKKPVHVKGALADLTPRGFIQADKIAERITRLPVQTIIASTMTRAQQTASVISKRINLPIESSDLFTERVEPSSLIGLVWDDPETQRQFRSWEDTFSTKGGRVGDGENFEDINLRATKALSFLSHNSAEHIVVVTHGYFMRVILGRILFGDRNVPDLVESLHFGLRTVNTGLTILHYNEADEHSEWWVSVWNDHAHLADA